MSIKQLPQGRGMSAWNPRPRPRLPWAPGPLAGVFNGNAACTSSMPCCTTIELATICSPGSGAHALYFSSDCRRSCWLCAQYARPTNDAGECVTPSNLIDHWHSHDFKGPCCLCASLNSSEESYTEAAIFMVTRGPSAGKYVAACATGQGRFWGKFKLVHIRMFVSRTRMDSLSRAILPQARSPGQTISSSR
jgi:hypothetical protein